MIVLLAAHAWAEPPADFEEPAPYTVYAPLYGLALGMTRPATSVEWEGLDAVGMRGDWVAVYPDPACSDPCAGTLIVAHAEGPATQFRVVLDADADAGPPPAVVPVPSGGAAVLTVGAEPAWHFPGDVEAVVVGKSLLMLPHGQAVHGFVRVAGEPPRPVALPVAAGWGLARGETEVVVRSGRTRRFRLDREALRVWVGDEGVARAEVRGRRLTLQGVAPGRTHVAIDDGSDRARLVRVVVPGSAPTGHPGAHDAGS